MAGLEANGVTLVSFQSCESGKVYRFGDSDRPKPVRRKPKKKTTKATASVKAPSQDRILNALDRRGVQRKPRRVADANALASFAAKVLGA